MSGKHGAATIVRSGLPLLVLLFSNVWCLAQENEVDDGWRRTRDGWERVATWNVTHWPGSPAKSRAWQQAIRSSNWDRWLFHPAALALGLALLGCCAVSLSGAVTASTADAHLSNRP